MDLANEKSWIWWGFTLCEMLASGKSRIMSHLSEAPGDLPAGLCGFLHLFLPLSGCGLWLLQWLSTWSLRCQMSAVYCGKPKAINLYKPSFFGGMPYVKCLPLISGHGNKDYGLCRQSLVLFTFFRNGSVPLATPGDSASTPTAIKAWAGGSVGVLWHCMAWLLKAHCSLPYIYISYIYRVY